jgi:hypothetical protein
MNDLDRAKEVALRELWSLVESMSRRRLATDLDLESWVGQLDHTRMRLNEALVRSKRES